ncbi:hypothetical protein [Synechococcus sp. CCY 9618]|uniref:hypothetical protein n=1 Tax=Synechococcus sp. CCY 9618 TaxID=2815602 RepID=UPI001C219575|nr:hypothetical protein [Synechococcus sp. CCY 9618]
MARPRRSLLLAGTLTLPLLLSGCGGTPFGDALSRSFSRAPASPAPTTPPATPAAPSPTPATPTTPARPPVTATPVAPATPAGEPAPAPRPAAAARPAPYRVTIRLPEADPSAPAEVLTRALRAAGVPFEVETIERMPATGAPAGEPPAAGAGTPAPPTSRPAPAPR